MDNTEALAMRYALPYTSGKVTIPPYWAGSEEVLKVSDKCLEAALKGYPQKSTIYYGWKG